MGCRAINDKNLKYEIETLSPCITMLKSDISINDKNLKYEIETASRSVCPSTIHRISINDKNLKYEIETN